MVKFNKYTYIKKIYLVNIKGGIPMYGLSFIKQYITKPRNVGAILPSSKYLANKMIENIDFETANYIVEYGPGTDIEVNIKRELRNVPPAYILCCNQIGD